MKNLTIHQQPAVEQKFSTYPAGIKPKLANLRRLILETAAEIDGIDAIEETLKWGEPSYLAKKGSTIRIDWKAKNPNQYAMYFKCTSKLVPTFKVLFGDTFKFESTRAILFDINEEVPEAALKECIGLALRYHVVKNEPLLGKNAR